MSETRLDTLTADSVRRSATSGEQRECLHLTLLWSRDEPQRLGETSALTRSALLGRGITGEPDDAPKLEFVRQRPGENEPTGVLRDAHLSRRQWALDPTANGVTVQNVGRRPLTHNGVRVEGTKAEAGDTLGVEGVVLCLVENRPRVLSPSGVDSFPFGQPDADGIVGESPAAYRLRAELVALAATDAHVLVLGPSGSGKELAARAIHRRSRRERGPLVSRNSATIPDGLVEAELFGSAANYPNAGMPARRGLIASAHGGTLFLDEIGELADAQQANLLRVLDSGEYQRLGEDGAKRSDFRLVAATNRSLEFLRHDLVARCPEHLLVPDLSARRADIPLLLQSLLPRVRSSTAFLAPELLDQLVRHRYTHNFRELERLVRLALRSSPPDRLELTPEVRAEIALPASDKVPTEADVRAALAVTRSITEAAKHLGVTSRFALARLMKKYAIDL